MTCERPSSCEVGKSKIWGMLASVPRLLLITAGKRLKVKGFKLRVISDMAFKALLIFFYRYKIPLDFMIDQVEETRRIMISVKILKSSRHC